MRHYSYFTVSLFSLIALSITVYAPASYAFFAEQLEVDITSKLCKIALALQGTIGRALAAVAIMLLGLGAIFGKISWASLITVVLGIAILYSSFAIVDMITEKTFLGIGGVFSACALAIVADNAMNIDQVFQNLLLSVD